MSDVVIWAALIALGASIIGWGLATWWLARQFRLENQRQHYYKTLEKTGEILDNCKDLADLVYQYQGGKAHDTGGARESRSEPHARARHGSEEWRRLTPPGCPGVVLCLPRFARQG